MNDCWLRDTAPTFVRHQTTGEVAGVCWTFDAWGQYCYSDWEEDAVVNRKVCAIEGLQVINPGGMVLEGGSIHVDGEGTLLYACAFGFGFTLYWCPPPSPLTMSSRVGTSDVRHITRTRLC